MPIIRTALMPMIAQTYAGVVAGGASVVGVDVVVGGGAFSVKKEYTGLQSLCAG